MTRGFEYSRLLAAAASGAVAVAGGMFWLHVALKARWSEHLRRASSVEARMSEQVAALSEFEAEKLEALRSKVGRVRVQLGPEDTWERLIAKLGDSWAVEAGHREERTGCSVQCGVFRLKSPVVSDWPAIVEALKDSEALPGVGIAEIEMQTSGNLERRSLDYVRILVTVQAARRGANLAESK
jgi:hypothetical protein